MGRKRMVGMCLVCMCLLLTGFHARAATSGGAEAVTEGDTEIMAGVAVDYMGKLQFRVLEWRTKSPIEGAAIELYIPSLERYVLLGLTSAEGVLEVDVAYEVEEDASMSDDTGVITPVQKRSALFDRANTDEIKKIEEEDKGDKNTFVNNNGVLTFTGTLLRLPDNLIAYRIYKSKYVPYPYAGTVLLETWEVPQVEEIYLQREKNNSDSGKGKSVGLGLNILPIEEIQTPKEDSGMLPKTGVEGSLGYWSAGLLFFLLAGGIGAYLLKKKTEDEQ